jgi:hypothetical protein
MKPLNQSEPISAEEFYSQFCSKRSTTGAFNGRERLQVMIEFAKMHVEAALKEASATDIVSGKLYKHICLYDKNSIINSYPLDKIK